MKIRDGIGWGLSHACSYASHELKSFIHGPSCLWPAKTCAKQPPAAVEARQRQPLSRLFRRRHLSRPRDAVIRGHVVKPRNAFGLSEESMSLPRARVRRLVPGATAIALIVGLFPHRRLPSASAT